MDGENKKVLKLDTYYLKKKFNSRDRLFPKFNNTATKRMEALLFCNRCDKICKIKLLE